MSARPLYPFGYGLSYTTFEYDNLNIEEIDDTKYQITLDVTNTGQRDGDEVVQLYIHDEYASTAQPLKQLKKFQRIFIPQGETRKVTFLLEAGLLAKAHGCTDRARTDLKDFMNERWKGMRPVTWGNTLSEAYNTALVYQDLCGVDQIMKTIQKEKKI